MFQQYTFLPAEDWAKHFYTEKFDVDVRTKNNWGLMEGLFKKWIVNKNKKQGPFPKKLPEYKLGQKPEIFLHGLTERLYATLKANGRYYTVIDENICNNVPDKRSPSFIDVLNMFFVKVRPK